jgi:DNA repair exonuclease SbcCD ATPase subunit
MADDIGAAVSKSISDTLNSVTKVLETSISTAGNSSQEIVNKVMNSIDGTLSKFSENLEKMEKSSSLQSDILEQFDNSVNKTTILAEKLEGIVPDMTEIARDFDASTQRLEKLPEALMELTEMQKEFTTVAKQNIELMNKNWETERERITRLVETLQQQFTAFEEGIVNGLQTTMGKFDDELSRAGTYFTTWLDRLNTDVTDFTKQVGTFSGVVQNGSSDLQSFMQTFTQSLSKQSSDIQTNVAQTSSTLKNGFKEIEDGLKLLPPELDKSIRGIEYIYKTASEQLPEMLAKNLENIVKEMDKTTRTGFGRFFNR